MSGFSMARGNPIGLIFVMALAIAVTADVTSRTPLLSSLLFRRILVLICAGWLLTEIFFISGGPAVACEYYGRPFAAFAVPFLLQPALISSSLERFLAGPGGKFLLSLAPYSSGFYAWQGVPSNTVLAPTMQPMYTDFHIPAPLFIWFEVTLKMLIMIAIAYASHHVLEKPLQRLLIG